MKYKILSVVGARPNFVKAAPVSKALKRAGCFDEIIVHTGQHYDENLSDNFFKELEIPPPTYNLGIGSGRQAWQLGHMIGQLDEVFEKEKPDAVIVFGDTNSTAAGAVAAAKANIPVVHVEAGLREFNKAIPEEVNKLLITAVADIFCCPTPTGVSNLKAGSVTKGVHLVGDVGIDLIVSKLDQINANRDYLKSLGLEEGKYYFMTCHRSANTNNRTNLQQILEAVEAVDLPVIFPIHPRTRKAIAEHGLNNPEKWPHVTLLPPLPFLETQTLLRFSKAAITDSGGIVKEAYFHKTPGLIIDRQIEWVETVEEGWNQIVGPNKTAILDALKNLSIPTYHSNCLGDGTASDKIAAILKAFFNNKISNPHLIPS